MRTSRMGIFALATLILAAVPWAPAAAGVTDCISIESATFSERLAVIAHGGRQVALGFSVPAPGDGVSLVAYISPTLCTGLGIPSPVATPGIDPASPGAALPIPSAPTAPDVPTFPALP